VIRYTQPSISDLEVEYATDAVRNGWGQHCYNYIHKFEGLFRDFVGTKHAMATSSCTGALHLGLAALGLKADDEVIIADINWIASVAPVVHLGAKPIFVDVLPDTWCIDPAAAAAAITPRTKAIIAVHLYGNVCDLKRLSALCTQRGIALIEDCAEAIGSCWDGNQVGSIGAFSVFSFHGTKTLTTGEGGALATNDEDLFSRAQILNNHGRSSTDPHPFSPGQVGYKFKMSNVQAAIGCAQMERANDLIAAKRKVFLTYQAAFSDLKHIQLNPEPEGTVNGYWMPTVVFSKSSGITAEKALDILNNSQIDARPFFLPLSSLPMFERREYNNVSYGIYCRAVNLPSYPELTDVEQRKVINAVRSLCK